MHRRIKIAGLSIVLVLLGLVAVLWLVWQDPNDYREPLARALTQAAGMPVSLDGEIRWSWQSELVLEVADISIDSPALQAKFAILRARADLASLWRAELRLREITLSGVKLNFLDNGAESSAIELPDLAQLPMEKLVLRDLRVQHAGEGGFAIKRIEIDALSANRTSIVPVQIVFNDSSEAAAQIQFTSEQVMVSDLLLRTPYGEIRGAVQIDVNTQPVFVIADLSAMKIASTSSKDTSQSEPTLPLIDLDPSLLSAFDADITFNVETITLAAVQMHTVSMPMQVRAGQLQLNAVAQIAEGRASLDAVINAQRQHWQSGLRLVDANAGALSSMLGLPQLRAGHLNFDAELQALGADSQALLHSLHGSTLLTVDEATIKTGTSRLLGADVLVGIAHTLRGTDSKTINLQCAVVRFAIKDGVMRSNNGIGAQSELANVLGGGVISLPKQRIDLLLRPWPREGLGLSATTLVGEVAIKGPLHDPKVALSDEALWRTGTSAGAAVLTGGLSLIGQALLEQSRGDSPCQQAQGGALDVKANVVRAKGATEQVSKAISQGADQAAREVRRGVQGLGKKLKGLFGGNSRPIQAPVNGGDR